MTSVVVTLVTIDSPEMRLLTLVARRELTASEQRELDTRIHSPIDWDLFVRLAFRHRLGPLAWWHLKSASTTIPQAAVQLLQQAFLQNAIQMLRRSAELLELCRYFDAQGILLVPYKGPALAAHLYGNVALRPAGDLDLLVRRNDVQRARRLLLDRGYFPRHELADGSDQFMLANRYHEEWSSPDGLHLELHWAFTNGDVVLPLDLDVLAAKLRTVQLGSGGGAVPIFGRDDLLLILAIHGCKHRWDRLEWLCGIAELMRVDSPTLDWDAMVARATRLGVRRMLLLSILVAHEILAAPVPGGMVTLARKDKAVLRLAREVPEILLEDVTDGATESVLRNDLFRLQLRERWVDRVRFVWYRATTPSRPEDWSTISVGGRLLPLHAILRPIRIVTKLMPALWSQGRGPRERS